MDKKKKIILISVVAIVVVLLIVGITWFFVARSNNTNEDGQITATTKTAKLYNTLQDKDSYSFTFTLNDNNKIFYAKSGDKAYTDTTYDGNHSKYIIKDGNSYLLMENSQRYYTYANNTIDLNLVADALDSTKELEVQEGSEEIEGKTYNYEEYAILTDLAIGDFSEESSTVKTRFYFKGNDLVYIKTISQDKQEILKVEMSTKVDKNLFEIPEDYTEG